MTVNVFLPPTEATHTIFNFVLNLDKIVCLFLTILQMQMAWHKTGVILIFCTFLFHRICLSSSLALLATIFFRYFKENLLNFTSIKLLTLHLHIVFLAIFFVYPQFITFVHMYFSFTAFLQLFLVYLSWFFSVFPCCLSSFSFFPDIQSLQFLSPEIECARRQGKHEKGARKQIKICFLVIPVGKLQQQ